MVSVLVNRNKNPLKYELLLLSWGHLYSKDDNEWLFGLEAL